MIIITKDSDNDVKYEVFERLNTGSGKLNDQELRNCVYRGKYNELIKELSDDTNFQDILQSPTLHERMLDSELILRFFAFYHTSYLRYRPPMKQFLNKEMEKYNDLNKEDEDDLRAIYKKSVDLTKTVFGEKAFRRFSTGSNRDHNGVWESNKINRGLFDIIMFDFTLYDKNQIVPFADAIKEELIWLMTSNDQFIDAIRVTTDKKDKIHYKFETWISSLRQLLGYGKSEPRNFSLSLKKELYNADAICAICNQRIQTLDDSEIDHIVHYWRGGKTVGNNARLVHRFCNRSRGGN